MENGKSAKTNIPTASGGGSQPEARPGRLPPDGAAQDQASSASASASSASHPPPPGGDTGNPPAGSGDAAGRNAATGSGATSSSPEDHAGQGKGPLPPVGMEMHGGLERDAPRPQTFSFTLSNGSVSGMSIVPGSAQPGDAKAIPLAIPAGASFTVNADKSITETISGKLGSDVLQFAQDAADPQRYHLISDTLTVNSPSTAGPHGGTAGIEFTISSGTVTGMKFVQLPPAAAPHDPAQEPKTGATPPAPGQPTGGSTTAAHGNPGKDGGAGAPSASEHGTADSSSGGEHSVPGKPTPAGIPAKEIALDPTAAFKIDTAAHTITETVVHGNVVETLQFVMPGTGGLYALASDSLSFIQAGSAKTLLDVEPAVRLKFTLDGAKLTQLQEVRPDGSTEAAHPIPATGKVTFAQPEAGYVVETYTQGKQTAYEVYHDGNGDGIYTAIAHGIGAVDLVGLKSQLTEIVQAAT